MCVPKTSNYIQTRKKMSNPNQNHPVFSKFPNRDLKDMDVICTFKIKMRAKIWNIGVQKTSDHIQTKTKIPFCILESPKLGLKGH